MPVKFAVGDRVLYPAEAEWRRWHDTQGGHHPRASIEGVVVKVIGDEHVFLNDGGWSWHVSWLEPVDDFAEWVREVRSGQTTEP